MYQAAVLNVLSSDLKTNPGQPEACFEQKGRNAGVGVEDVGRIRHDWNYRSPQVRHPGKIRLSFRSV